MSEKCSTPQTSKYGRVLTAKNPLLQKKSRNKKSVDKRKLEEDVPLIKKEPEKACSCCCLPLGKTFVKCENCKDIYLCLMCHRSGWESAIHKKSHTYICMDLFFKENWTDEEELKLIHFLSKKGRNRWDLCSEQLERRHTADECQKHYEEFYQNNPNFPSGPTPHKKLRIQSRGDTFLENAVKPSPPIPYQPHEESHRFIPYSMKYIQYNGYLASIGEFTNIDDDDMSRPEIDFMKNTKNNTGKVPEIQKLMGDRIYDYYLFGYVDKE